MAPTAPTARSYLLPEFNLKDKVVIVTGGARGLGLIQSEGLLEAGAIGEPLSPGGFYGPLSRP
jgi:hypothetical protein